VNPFTCLNPFNSAEWWEMVGHTRGLCSASQRAALQFIGVNPSPLPVDWFLSYSIVSG
jgi:hypothetical protein